jgi:potassium/sodium efflux P-type ATPase
MVVATGDATQIGQIADMLRDVQGVDTPLIKRLTYFSKVITLAIVLFCVLVFVLGILSGQTAMQMLMAAVALAVSAIPEGLPAIMTIALAIGVKRMAARNAVIRKLPAVEALGSTTVICTDKTGTLTRNEMTVTAAITVEGAFTIQGSGYSPEGAIFDSTGNATSLDRTPALAELVQAGALCNDAALRRRDGQWHVEGDPTEGSLLVLAAKAGLDLEELMAAWPRTDAIPFESEQQYMATLHRNHADRDVIYLKGSPEKVLSLCRGERRADHPLDLAPWREAVDEMAGRGLRVLAVAAKRLEGRRTILEYSDTESGFLLLGLIGMMDPPREEAIQAVARCRAAGIRVKMITGDHVATAQAVGRQLGIGGDGRALSGNDIDRLSEREFDSFVADFDIFARVSPAHKLQFVQSLQRQGQIVAMTGDGVNDAPALKQADIGVAMGVTGTDVSKEAAEMVLLDDNFVSIERAVEEGRTVFNNLKKTILFILPTNGGECLTLMAALLLGVVLPILPLHILWINLITTVALAITLAFDPVDVDVMKRPPRDPKSPLIDRPLVWRISYVSVLMALGTFGLFYYELWTGSSLEVARAVAVNLIVFFEVAYLFNSRHLIECTLNRRGILGNVVVWWGIAVVVGLQVIFTYWPPMSSLFHVAPMDGWMWLRVLTASLGLLLFVEAEKAVARKFAGATIRPS